MSRIPLSVACSAGWYLLIFEYMLVRTAFSFAFLFACILHRLESVSLRLKRCHKTAFATATAFPGSSTLKPTASIKVEGK